MNKLYNKILQAKYIPDFIGIFLVIFINWFFQSLLYMGWTEKFLKLFIDFIILVVFFIIFKSIFGLLASIIISFVIAHTLNWIFNGHIFALLKTFGNIKTDPEKFVSYQNQLKERSLKERSILLVATFGSLSRKELNENSDLDLRVIRKRGIISAFRSSIFVLIERSRAFFNKFPIDIYLCDDMYCITQMKEDPVVIYDANQLLE